MAVSTITRILRSSSQSRSALTNRAAVASQTQMLKRVQQATAANKTVIRQLPKTSVGPVRQAATPKQTIQRATATVTTPIRQTVNRVQRAVNPVRTPAGSKRAASTATVRPTVSTRVTTPVARQVQQAGSAAGTRSSVLQRIRDNPLVSAVLGTGATVGGLLLYDNISQRMDVPEDVQNLDSEYKQTVLRALEAILAGQNQVVMPNGEIIDVPAYDTWTNQVPLGDTGYTLGLPAADTGIDWIDSALDDGGAVIYDDAGEPVAVIDETGAITGLLDSEIKQIKKRDGINWAMWIALGSLAALGGYWVYRRRRAGLPVVQSPLRKSRSTLV